MLASISQMRFFPSANRAHVMKLCKSAVTSPLADLVWGHAGLPRIPSQKQKRFNLSCPIGCFPEAPVEFNGDPCLCPAVSRVWGR